MKLTNPDSPEALYGDIKAAVGAGVKAEEPAIRKAIPWTLGLGLKVAMIFTPGGGWLTVLVELLLRIISPIVLSLVGQITLAQLFKLMRWLLDLLSPRTVAAMGIGPMVATGDASGYQVIVDEPGCFEVVNSSRRGMGVFGIREHAEAFAALLNSGIRLS